MNNQPTCQLCVQDLQHVFSSATKVKDHWNGPLQGWNDACRCLEIVLGQRLAAPCTTQEVLLDEIRYTHDSIANQYRHGPHRCMQVQDLSQALLQDQVMPEDEGMILAVVWHHGFYRSLNNRHLDAHKRAQTNVTPQFLQKKYPCSVQQFRYVGASVKVMLLSIQIQTVETTLPRA